MEEHYEWIEKFHLIAGSMMIYNCFIMAFYIFWMAKYSFTLLLCLHMSFRSSFKLYEEPFSYQPTLVFLRQVLVCTLTPVAVKPLAFSLNFWTLPIGGSFISSGNKRKNGGNVFLGIVAVCFALG